MRRAWLLPKTFPSSNAAPSDVRTRPPRIVVSTQCRRLAVATTSWAFSVTRGPDTNQTRKTNINSFRCRCQTIVAEVNDNLAGRRGWVGPHLETTSRTLRRHGHRVLHRTNHAPQALSESIGPLGKEVDRQSLHRNDDQLPQRAQPTEHLLAHLIRGGGQKRRVDCHSSRAHGGRGDEGRTRGRPAAERVWSELNGLNHGFPASGALCDPTRLETDGATEWDHGRVPPLLWLSRSRLHWRGLRPSARDRHLVELKPG